MFQKKKKFFVAYADSEGKNEFLIQDGHQYYILTSQKDIISISSDDAKRILKLMEKKILSIRGLGTFNKRVLNIAEEMAYTIQNVLRSANDG
ncbi:hypothetical protein [Oceanobacillus oncorhynchi]|uniref:hypothetical protein n=1 Tax=Oceanobacillus oncorhynchi TaxID=545501 RepID=UPI001866B377|nr:hypothetical protein [Oceanobacillus oncorhynchi]